MAAAPSLPPEAEGTSPAAAKAFVRHYFDVINFSARTGETELLRSLGTPGCVSCDAIASNIEDIYSAGGHIESDGWQLQHIRFVTGTERLSTLSLGVRLAREVVVSGSGDTDSNPPARQPMTIRLRSENGSFHVHRLDLVK